MADDGYLGFSIYWIEEWSQFFADCNWYTFHPLMIEFEDERNMGGVEATVIVLGLGLRVRWNYAVTDDLESIREQIAEIERATPLPDQGGDAT